MKTLPEQFGGGRARGRPQYSAEGIRRLMCSRAGCGRRSHASWGACADENVQRPLCAECDVEVNRIMLDWIGDPDADEKMAAYVAQVEQDVGRRLYAPAS